MKFTAALALCLTLMFVPSKASMLKGSNQEEARQLSKKMVKTPEYRNCEFDESTDQVTFECKATNAPDKEDSASEDEEATLEDEPEARGIVLEPAIEIRDKIKYKVETSKKGVQIKIEYEQEYEEAEGTEEELSGESETTFEIDFESIIEYEKVGDYDPSNARQQAYNWNVDNVVQTLSLEDWNPLSTVATSDGIVSHFSASSEDLVAAFNFSISRGNEGDKLTANTMKIDVHITNFPWQRNDTFLALLSTVKSELDVDVKHDDEASVLLARDNIQVPFTGKIDTIGFVPFGSYSWENNAEAIETDSNSTGGDVVFMEPVSVERSAGPTETATGMHASQIIQVVATSPVSPVDSSNETSTSMEMTEMIAYSFVGSAAQNASYIYWDPEAGIGYEDSDDNDYTIFGGNGDPMQMASSATTFIGKFGCLAGLLLNLGAVFLVVA